MENATPSPTSTTYTSAKGYSIAYPSDWSKPQEQNNGTTVLFLTPTNNETENLNVVVFNLSASDTLSSETDSILSEVKGFSNYTLIDAANTTLAGNPAYKIVYTGTTSKGDNLKFTQIWTVKDGKEYFITYKGAPPNYEKHLSAAQKMIDSFQITVQATATAAPTVKATATPAATATPKPTATPTPDYSSKLNSNTGWLGEGYAITTQFKKTTVNGREAYVGSLTKTGYTMPVQIFPMSSYSDAVSYREQLINNYKAQGYITSDTTDDSWQGTLGTTMVDVSALSTTVIDQPVTMVLSTNIV